MLDLTKMEGLTPCHMLCSLGWWQQFRVNIDLQGLFTNDELLLNDLGNKNPVKRREPWCNRKVPQVKNSTTGSALNVVSQPNSKPAGSEAIRHQMRRNHLLPNQLVAQKSKKSLNDRKVRVLWGFTRTFGTHDNWLKKSNKIDRIDKGETSCGVQAQAFSSTQCKADSW